MDKNTFKENINHLQRIATLDRHLISEGYDSALAYIRQVAEAKGLQFKLHSYPTGHDCGTWIIPEQWKLHRAELRDKNGKVLLDSVTEPLACVSYSLPFEGWVDRTELFDHLHTSPHCSDAIPFVFKYYKRDWGLSCSQQFKETLQDDKYYVKIETAFVPGELKVGEIILPGKFEESFVIASHLCHPHQINDGPIGVFPTMDILRAMKAKGTNYTFRQLIVPENVGSAAWLSGNRSLIPLLKGGLFVEMLGTDLPLRLHRSFKGNTLVDALFQELVQNSSPANEIDDFTFANDERQFNGPGVKVPMLGLNRSNMGTPQLRTHKLTPAFKHYHTSFDVLDNLNLDHFRESIAVLEKLLAGFDNYLVKPVPHFIGEPFLTRYNLHIDSFEGVAQMRQFDFMMNVLFLTGDNHTIFEIARQLKAPIDTVKQLLDKFVEINLMSYRPASLA